MIKPTEINSQILYQTQKNTTKGKYYQDPRNMQTNSSNENINQQEVFPIEVHTDHYCTLNT